MDFEGHFIKGKMKKAFQAEGTAYAKPKSH